MAIYTTELITDRDYNIPEGRLPLEYAVDQANKNNKHSENAEVHVSAVDRESWNGKLDQDAVMEERDAVVELYDAEAEKWFCAGNYAVISGSRVPGGELLRVTSAAMPSVNMPDGSAAGTRLLVLEQRESAGASWREVGRSAVQVGEEEFGAVASPVPVWEFTGCKLVEGQDLRIRSENEAGAVVPLFIYTYSVDDDGCYVYNNSTSAEQPGWLAVVKFYLTQNVSKYATAGELDKHTADTEVHVTADEKASWNRTTQHGDIVYDLNKMFPDAGETTNGPTKLWKQFYAINRIRRYFYDIDVANGDTDPETGFTYSKKMMVPGIKIRHYRAALSGYIPDPFWATYSWVGGNIDWNWNPDTDGNTNEFDDFSNTTKWQFSVTEHQFDLHLDGETTDSSGNFTRHITDEEREKWNAASTLAPHAAFLSAAATGDWSTCKYALLQFYDANAMTGTHPCSISVFHSAEKLQELNYVAHSFGGWIEQISDSMMLLYCGKNDSFTSNDFGTFVLFPLVNRIPHSICYLNLPMEFHLEV